MSQFFAESIGVITCIVTIGTISIIVYKIIDKLVGNRVDIDAEIEGLDVPEMGVPGYGGMMMDKHSESPVSR